MLSVTAKLDKQKLRALERATRGHQKSMPRIVVRALKATAKRGKTEIDRRVRQELNVTKKAVMDRIVDAEKASFSHWRWRLDISGRRLALASVKGLRQTKKGVSYAITPGRRRVALHAFKTEGFTHAGSGRRIESKSVWRRAMTGDKAFSKGRPVTTGPMAGKIVQRMPLVFLRARSIGHVVKDSATILSQVHRKGQLDLGKQIDHQVKLSLQKRFR